MPNLSVSYYVWKEGAKRRSPDPKFDIISIENKWTDDPTAEVYIPGNWEDESKVKYPLAFISVSGSANGHFIITGYPNPVYIPTPSDPPPDFDTPPPHTDQIFIFHVAKDSDLTISVWFLPASGPGTGTRAYIDSFNVDTGQFFYDSNIANDFVTISPDAGLTTDANDLGFVPTASTETITSHEQILGIPFLNWTVMSSSSDTEETKPVVNGKDMKVYANTTVAAIAFFGTQNKKPFFNFWVFYEVLWSRLWPDDYCGTPPQPNPPWPTALKQLGVLLTMHESIHLVVPEHRMEFQTKIVSLSKTLTEGLNKAVR